MVRALCMSEHCQTTAIAVRNHWSRLIAWPSKWHARPSFLALRVDKVAMDMDKTSSYGHGCQVIRDQTGWIVWLVLAFAEYPCQFVGLILCRLVYSIDIVRISIRSPWISYRLTFLAYEIWIIVTNYCHFISHDHISIDLSVSLIL